MSRASGRGRSSCACPGNVRGTACGSPRGGTPGKRSVDLPARPESIADESAEDVSEEVASRARRRRRVAVDGGDERRVRAGQPATRRQSCQISASKLGAGRRSDSSSRSRRGRPPSTHPGVGLWTGSTASSPVKARRRKCIPVARRGHARRAHLRSRSRRPRTQSSPATSGRRRRPGFQPSTDAQNVLLLHEHRDAAAAVRERGLDHEPVAVSLKKMTKAAATGAQAEAQGGCRAKRRAASGRRNDTRARRNWPVAQFGVGGTPRIPRVSAAARRCSTTSTRTSSSPGISFFPPARVKSRRRPKSAQRGHQAQARERTHAQGRRARPESGRQVEVDRRRAFRAPRREG